MCVLLLSAGTHAAGAAAVLGTGGAESCADTTPNAAFAGGGRVTFDGGGPAPIDISAPTMCIGDCDGNGTVAINELVLGADIVLGPQAVNACPAFANPQGVVDVAQLLKGVNNALHGCEHMALAACEALSGRSTHDATLDTLHFSPNDHQAELEAYSAFADATNSDLSAFTARGGKLILWHGLADYAASPRSTVRYYERVVDTLGRDSANDFIRFYTSPGVGHLNDGPGAGTTDFLSALTTWVETGTPPGELVSAKLGPGSPGPLLTRPLCRYPAYPHYDGTGDPREAASFHCTSVVGTGTPASCTDRALTAALAAGGLVTFDCGGPATIDSTDTKAIREDTTIDGGAVISISGGNSGSLFNVAPGVDFTVRSLTIVDAGNSAIVTRGNASLTVTNSTFAGNAGSGGGAIRGGSGMTTISHSSFNGNSAYGGGAIFSERGTLAIANSTFAGNRAWGAGAIYAFEASVNVTNSTFTDNEATGDDTGKPGDGGAIILDNSDDIGTPSLSISNSTFAGNSAVGDGGAIQLSDDRGPTSLNVSNSTFTVNHALGHGGAINSGVLGTSSLDITNSTFSGNDASDGGDAIHGNGSSVLRNTIVAGGSSGGGCEGALVDGGHNLDDGTSCGFSTANGSLSATDPQLDPSGLQDNGGPTRTVALCTGAGAPAGCTAASPALDAGDQAVCGIAPVKSLDQRGFVRPGTGHANCSIGAYEPDATAP